MSDVKYTLVNESDVDVTFTLTNPDNYENHEVDAKNLNGESHTMTPGERSIVVWTGGTGKSQIFYTFYSGNSYTVICGKDFNITVND